MIRRTASAQDPQQPSKHETNQRISQSVSDNSWINYPPATASTVSYTSNPLNQYTAVGAVSPTYDGNGNLTSDGTFTYGYDGRNRLTSAVGAGNTTAYAYDATVFVTDADNREVLEYDGASGAIQRHDYGPAPSPQFETGSSGYKIFTDKPIQPNSGTQMPPLRAQASRWAKPFTSFRQAR